jgi:hypothetical protein
MRKNKEKITAHRWERRQWLSREEALIFKLAIELLMIGYREFTTESLTH